MRHLLELLTVFLLFASPSSAQRLIGIDSLDGRLAEFDVQTGRAHPLSDTGMSRYLWHSLAVDGQGRLYAGYGLAEIADIAIYEIEPDTGATTFVAQTTLGGVTALAFGPGDVLYAVNDPNAPFTSGPDDLVVIDLATGQTTVVGSTGLVHVASLDWYGDTLWGVDVDLGLVRIDPVTAQATDVNAGFHEAFALSPGIAFRPDGVLYFSDGGLWVMDPKTGIPGAIGYDQWWGIFGAIEWLEGPSPAPPALGIRGLRGDLMSAHASGMTPFGKVVFAYSLGAGGPTTVPPSRPCAGTVLDLRDPPILAELVLADGLGRARTPTRLAPWVRRGRLHLQAIDLTTCRTTNPLRVVY